MSSWNTFPAGLSLNLYCLDACTCTFNNSIAIFQVKYIGTALPPAGQTCLCLTKMHVATLLTRRSTFSERSVNSHCISLGTCSIFYFMYRITYCCVIPSHTRPPNKFEGFGWPTSFQLKLYYSLPWLLCFCRIKRLIIMFSAESSATTFFFILNSNCSQCKSALAP